MTGLPYYLPAAEQPPLAPDTAGPIQVAVAPRARARRATVALRIILALPHIVVVYVLGIVALPVAIIGWFGALATGRLPGFAVSYLSGYLGWYYRLAAYLLLLTDAYPAFSSSDDSYPARLLVRPGRLSRVTVLFRLILVIPAWIVAVLLLFSLTTLVMPVITWLITLISGRMPNALQQAYTAMLRYLTRYLGYLLMLTDSYPSGLFGDRPVVPTGMFLSPGTGMPFTGQPTAPDAGALPADAGAEDGPQEPATLADGTTPAEVPQAEATQAEATQAEATQAEVAPAEVAPAEAPQEAGHGDPGAAGSDAAPAADAAATGAEPPAETPTVTLPPWAAGYGQPGSYPGAAVPGTPPAAPPSDWRLYLSPTAKSLVGLLLVLGLIAVSLQSYGATAKILAIRKHNREVSQLDTAVAKFNASVTRHNAAVASEQHKAAQTANELTQLNTANGQLIAAGETLSASTNSALNKASACASISCIQTTAKKVYGDINTFTHSVQAIELPSTFGNSKATLITDLNQFLAAWAQVEHTTSAASLQADDVKIQSIGILVQQDTDAFNKALSGLVTKVTNQNSALAAKATSLTKQAATLNKSGAALKKRAVTLNTQVHVQNARSAQ